MALNEIKRDAVSFSVRCASNVESGDLIALNSGLAGIAEVDAHEGEVAGEYWTTIRTEGIFAVPVGSHSSPVIGESVTITPPSAGPAEVVALASTGTKVGTIVGIPDSTTLWVALNK